MRRELLASKKKETGLSLDPRTKLALLITIALFVLSGGGGAASKQFAPILAAVPLILLLTEKCQDNDGQRVCCLYEEAAFTGADHHSYVRDIPIFPYGCRRI